jgi:hypothetical protein
MFWFLSVRRRFYALLARPLAGLGVSLSLYSSLFIRSVTWFLSGRLMILSQPSSLTPVPEGGPVVTHRLKPKYRYIRYLLCFLSISNRRLHQRSLNLNNMPHLLVSPFCLSSPNRLNIRSVAIPMHHDLTPSPLSQSLFLSIL